MQNEKKYIRYKGITRLPSEHDSFDGELEDVVNMALTGGELRPVLPPAFIGTIQGQFMFVHKNQGFEHFIYLDGNVIKAYKHESGTLDQIACNINIGTSFLKSLDAIGNTLIILTNKDILYALWKPDTNNYLNLGSDIPFPVIQFALESVDLGLYATSASFEINQDNAGERNYFNLIKETVGSDVESDMNTGSSFIPKAFANDLPADQLEAKNKITNRVAGEINKYLKFALDSKAHMFPFFVRYAIRLYDGTLVKHSPPLLMLPSKFIPFRAGPYNLNEVTTDSNQLDRTIDIVFSDPSRLKYKPTSVFPQLFSDIVESVDIFISGPIYTFVQDMDLNGSITYDPPYENAHRFGGLYKSKNAVLKQIAETSTFFKVASLPIDDMGSTSMLSYVPMDDLSTLLNQEVMTDDYRSHEKVIAETSFTYNHKLHLSGVKRRPFYGFKYGSGGNYYSIQNYGTVMANQIYSFDSQPYIFHPDPNAKEMITVASAEEYRLKLTEHKGLNGSFYLDPELSSPYLGVGIAVLNHSRLTLAAKCICFCFCSLVIPDNTSKVGEIIHPRKQFHNGQFPLYAFTDDGIWALEVGK